MEHPSGCFFYSTFNLPTSADLVFRGTNISTEIGGITNGRLPNIRGIMNGGLSNSQTPSGAFYVNFSDAWGAGTKGATENYLGFDASRVASVYADDFNAVRPKSILVYFLIKYI